LAGPQSGYMSYMAVSLLWAARTRRS
jgi:hypothetical protein